MAVLQASRQRQPRWWATRGLLAVAVLLVLLLAWFWKPLNAYAQTGAAYGARIGCSCRFVAGRSLAACRSDFEGGMEAVMLSGDDAAKTVTASVPLLATDTARMRPGQGCRLDPWPQGGSR